MTYLFGWQIGGPLHNIALSVSQHSTGFPRREWYKREQGKDRPQNVFWGLIIPSVIKPQKTYTIIILMLYGYQVSPVQCARELLQGMNTHHWGSLGTILEAAYLTFFIRSCEYTVEALTFCFEDKETFFIPREWKLHLQEWGCEPRSSEAGCVSTPRKMVVVGLSAAQIHSPLWHFPNFIGNFLIEVDVCSVECKPWHTLELPVIWGELMSSPCFHGPTSIPKYY